MDGSLRKISHVVSQIFICGCIACGSPGARVEPASPKVSVVRAVTKPTTTWEYTCEDKKVLDMRVCTLRGSSLIGSSKLGVVFVRTGLPKPEECEILVVGTELHPAGSVFVRIDENAPIGWKALDAENCDLPVFKTIISQMLNGTRIRVLAEEWPSRKQAESEYDLAEFSSAYRQAKEAMKE